MYVGSDLNTVSSWYGQQKGKGLAYCGVTLVPPCSLKAFIDVIADNSELSELKKLLENALSNNKWVIHYGL